MRIAVCIKYVPDPATVEVDPLSGAIDEARTLYIMSPADGAALEMALRLGTSEGAVEALSVGPPEAEAVLRDALAVGAGSVQRLWDDQITETNPAMTAYLLAMALETEAGLPDLVLCGARSIDKASGKMPALLSEFLGWPVATDITHFEIRDGSAFVQRRLERGARAEGEVKLPAVLGLEPGMARLRHASLPGLMEAKRTLIPVRHLEDLGLSIQDLNFPRVTIHQPSAPRPRPRTIFIPDVELPPHERVAQIVSAGVADKAGKVIEGSPQDMADAIIDFLRERGLLEQRL